VIGSVIRPDSNGDVFLSATNAALHGSQLQLETRGGLPDIGYWDSGDAWVSWTAQMPTTGIFNVSATVATLNAEASFVVEVGGEIFSAQAPQTGSWDKFQTIDIGRFQIIQPGELVVKVRAKDQATWKAINLNSVELTPTSAQPATAP
jgi:alpha-L-fucosidase